jgi:hypothetical protein
MRHFSLLKLLTVSSFSTSSSDCLSKNQNSIHGSGLTSRGLQLKKTLTTIECIEISHEHQSPSNRRQALHSMMGFGAGLAFLSWKPKVTDALDMDAFVNSQVTVIELC